MIVVSDTTAITTLLKAGEERLLKERFGSVIVPNAVWDELLAFHSALPEFVVLKAVTQADIRLSGTESLGRGEAEAIKLARDLGADLLLVDDRKAHAAAQALGIKCTSLLALVVEAKHDGRIVSVRTAIEAFEKRGGLYLSESAKEEAIRAAGEILE